MLSEELKRRQAQLRDYLCLMAADYMDETQVLQMAEKFKMLYSDDFRHSYSDFFPFIVDIAKDESKYSLDYLSNNLEDMRSLVEKNDIAGEEEFKGLYQPLTKLSDHINLEIGRYTYYFHNEQKLGDLEKRNEKLQVELESTTIELKGAKEAVSSVQTELESTTAKLKDAQETVNSMQAELIAVLSIFAAVVFTFSGSITLIGSAFSSIASVSVFKSLLILSVSGLVLANTVFLMMYIVGKITGRNIYARCKTEDCSCGTNGEPRCGGFVRIKKRLPYVFWLNVLFLSLIIFDLVAWRLNMQYHFFVE